FSKLEVVGVVFADMADQEVDAMFDLDPGSYIAVCFIPIGGGEEGPPHFTGGMVAEFDVVAWPATHTEEEPAMAATITTPAEARSVPTTAGERRGWAWAGAVAGLASVAIMLLVGGGISTELFWALMQDHGKADPDIVAANLGIFDTMAWVWAGIGLTSGSLAVAGIRH